MVQCRWRAVFPAGHESLRQGAERSENAGENKRICDSAHCVTEPSLSGAGFREAGPPYLVVKGTGGLEASYEMRWADRLIPSFSIRCLKVFGCMPRIFAAPFEPSITP